MLSSVASRVSAAAAVVPRWRTVTRGGGLSCAGNLASAYDVHEPIGYGGFGKVYRGVQKRSGAEVAIKTMSKTRANHSAQETLHKLRREISLLKSVSECEYIARFVDCFEDEESVHLVTDICKGGNLDDHVKLRGPLDETVLAVVASQVLHMLRCCHSSGVVYADVKPANLCRLSQSPSSPVKAVDFGCSRRTTGSSARLSALTGTPAFMAPEVFRRDSSYKADVWSLGVTLYWLYAARLPFWENAEMAGISEMWQVDRAVSHACIRYDYGPWRHMTAEGLSFVRACLERRESDRLSAEEALRHPWIASSTNRCAAK